MKRYILFFAFFAIAVVASAQEFAISGRVVDAQNNESLPLAQISLLAKDSTTVAAVVSDENGYFLFSPKKAGDYILTATFLGYEPLWKNVKLTEKSPQKKLGRLQLSADSKLLSEFQVTGLANELSIKADTFVYHSNAYRVAEGASIAALIKQLPGLSMDGDGNLTFQGKKVDNILVNGKPFFGDVNTAMSNMTSDAVQDVQIYKKTNEDKEFTGEHDTNKATVIDLKIKKEYMSSWNVNLNGGGGTHERYLGKVFTSNFSDKYRAALFAQVNNISQGQQVDENGNWYHWGGMGGFFTYRKAGTIISWDNGKTNADAGYLQGNFNTTVRYDNSNVVSQSNNETFLSQSSLFGYNKNSSRGRDRDINVNATITWNIDTLNRVNFHASYSYFDNLNNSNNKSSQYSCAQSMLHPYLGLVGEDIDETLKAQGINSVDGISGSSSRSNRGDVSLYYTRRFKNSSTIMNFDMHYSFNSNRRESDNLSHYRYFSPDVLNDYNMTRRYNVSPTDNYRYNVSMSISGNVISKIRYNLGYSYNHNKNKGINSIYCLERLNGYNSPLLPAGVHPSTLDSLLIAIDVANSHNSIEYTNNHALSAGLSGNWEKVESHISLHATHKNEHLYYQRDNKSYSPSRKYVDWTINGGVILRPVKNGEFDCNYSGGTGRQSLVSLLPLTDTSNEMVVSVNNPNLKNEWNNSVNMRVHWFNDKRGDNYNLHGYFSWSNNTPTSITQTDEQTGKQLVTVKSLNGNYNGSLWLSTEQPLDSARHWTLRVNGSMGFARNKNFIGSMGDELGLSVVHRYSPGVRMSLRWREGIWSVNVASFFSSEISRYKENKEYNQSGNIFEASIQPQVEFPFGFRINTSFGIYERTGYESELLNHNQVLWNATISQSLLKSKALTLQLEAVDILHQRTAEWSHISPQSRNDGRLETFLSYVMFSAIYRFNVGGK